MRVVVQRCINAKVMVDNKTVGKIDKGYVLFVGFTDGDNEEIIKKIAKKIINLRIFEDDNNKMNLDISSKNADILSISQFTLYANVKSRRPSFTNAMCYNDAKVLYKLFNDELRKNNILVEEGIFGADMKVSLTNDGPITILIDSEDDL